MFILSLVMAVLMVGTTPPVVVLEGEKGGTVDGKPFSTEMIKGKVYLVIYADPDKRDLNEDFAEAIKKQQFDKSRFGSIAIINMKATWIPNFVLNGILKKKQEKYPNTIYVKDYDKVFVKKWGLKDDDYNVMLFDKEGKLLFYKSGKLTEEDTRKVIQLIKENL
ncbi:YtfJ family protein [Persephonella sp.]|nr:transcriptional regulator [Aquificota bacterium]